MSTQSDLLLQRLLNQLVTQGAQELHLSVGQRPVIRRDGVLSPLPGEDEVLKEDHIVALAKSLFSEAEWERLQETKDLLTMKGINTFGRFRVSAYFQRGTVSITLKLIPTHIPELAELHIPSSALGMIQQLHGLVIITGPLDSGRSTVAMAYIRTILRERSVRVMTLEDPVEYVLPSEKGFVEQRQVGVDVDSFSQGLQLLNTEDVDVVFVSDIRDEHIAHDVVHLALSNRLVIVTMTNDSAVRSLQEFVHVACGDNPEQNFLKDLSDALKIVINVRLIQQKTNTGRILATEILLNTQELAFALRENDFTRIQNILHTSRQEGMVTLDQSLVELVNQGIISSETAQSEAREPQRFGRVH